MIPPYPMIHLSDHFPENVVDSIEKFLVEYIGTENQELARIDLSLMLLALQKFDLEKQTQDLK